MDLFEKLGSSIDENQIMTQLKMKNNSERVLVLNQEIDSFIIDNYELFILNWNREDKGLPVDKRKPIKIYINSVGGDMYSAMSLIDVIQSSITPVIGVGFGLIASAAFHVYIACHKRIAFPNSVFLMHDGELNISNSTSKAKDTMKFLNRMETRIKDHVLHFTIMDSEYYDSHFDQEIYMYADEAKELGVVDMIVGFGEICVNDII